MTAIELEIQTIVEKLAPEQKQKVLAFVQELTEPPKRHYKPSELMALPLEERNRIMREQFASAANQEFEIFEANEVEESS